MRVYLILILSSSLVSQIAIASWDEFDGVTRWRVQVTEDESGCGGGQKTSEHMVPIVHHKQVAEIGDWGHGPASGTFRGSTLTLPTRTIPDGSGRSKLYDAELQFTPDCSIFNGAYRWDYADSQMRCSGATSLRGSRIDAKGCPQAQPPSEEALQARRQTALSDEIVERRSQENQYKDALSKNPKDFWANWDMAELKKKQGNYKDYFNYLNRAMDNEKVFAKTRAQLKDEARTQLGLAEYPNPASVPLLRDAEKELSNGGMVYDVKFPKPGPFLERWQVMLWSAWVPDSSTIIQRVVKE